MKAQGYQIEALKPQLEKTFKAALIHGSDFSVVEDYAQKIIHTLLEKPDDFSLIKVSKATLKETPTVLLDEANATSFFSSRKVIWLKDADNFILDALENYLSFVQTDTFLLITADALPKSSGLRTFTENAPDVLSVACYQDTAKDTRLMIASYLKEQGRQFNNDVLDLLCDRLNENRTATKSQLEKLITYIGSNNTITLKDVQAVIEDTSTASMDTFCHAVALGDQKTADKNYRILIANGETPTGITRLLLLHFNKLLSGANMLAQGQSSDTIQKKLLRANQFMQKEIFLRQVYTWPCSYLIKTLDMLLDTEKQTKSSLLPAELVLERAVTTICALAKRLKK